MFRQQQLKGFCECEECLAIERSQWRGEAEIEDTEETQTMEEWEEENMGVENPPVTKITVTTTRAKIAEQ